MKCNNEINDSINIIIKAITMKKLKKGKAKVRGSPK